MKTETKVWIFFGILSLLVLIWGFHLGGREGLFISFWIDTLFWALFMRCDPLRTLHNLNAEELLGRDPWDIIDHSTRIAHQLSLKAPRIFLVHTHYPVATAWVGTDQRNYICISHSLIKKFHAKDLEILITYLVCSLINKSQFTHRLGLLLTESVLLWGDLMDSAFNKLNRNKSRRVTLFSRILDPIAWVFLRLFAKSTSFYRIDDITSDVINSRKALAEFLWKMESLTQARPPVVPPCSAHSYVVTPHPLIDNRWYRNPHPQLTIRTKRLVGTEYL